MLNKAFEKSICIYATSPLMWDWYPFVAKKMVHYILYWVFGLSEDMVYLASAEKESHRG